MVLSQVTMERGINLGLISEQKKKKNFFTSMAFLADWFDESFPLRLYTPLFKPLEA